MEGGFCHQPNTETEPNQEYTLARITLISAQQDLFVALSPEPEA
jgi:hypothetical protein